MHTPDAPAPSEKADQKARRLMLILLGGLLIGLATSLPLAVVWPDTIRPPVGVCLSGTEANPMERIWVRGKIIPLPCMPTFAFIQPPVWGGFLGSGIVYGLIAHDLARKGSRWLLAALGGFCLFILSYLGGLFVPRLTGPELPLFLSSGVAEPFALMIFGISLLFALVMGLALRTPGFVWRALGGAMLTAGCHWSVTWFLLGRAVLLWTHDPTSQSLAHSLPVLGNGMGPMMTTIMISNLIAGTVGGAVTLALLTASQFPGRSLSFSSLRSVRVSDPTDT